MEPEGGRRAVVPRLPAIPNDRGAMIVAGFVCAAIAAVSVGPAGTEAE